MELGYKPGMDNLPEMALPDVLPDLPGVAELSWNTVDTFKPIAPSIGIDLPEVAVAGPEATPASAPSAPMNNTASAGGAPPPPPPPPSGGAPPPPPPPPPSVRVARNVARITREPHSLTSLFYRFCREELRPRHRRRRRVSLLLPQTLIPVSTMSPLKALVTLEMICLLLFVRVSPSSLPAKER